MDNLNIQALLTKGSLLSSVKRKSEAIDHYREVVRLSPFNYEGNKGRCDYTDAWLIIKSFIKFIYLTLLLK